MFNCRLSLRRRWWKTRGTSWPSSWWTWWRGRSRGRKIFRFDFLSFFQSFAECCLTEDDGGDGDDAGGGAGELLADPISEAARQQTQGAWGGRRQNGRQGETLITTMAATITFFQVKQLLVDCGAEELVPVFAKKKVKNAISAIGVALQKALVSLQKIYSTADQNFASRWLSRRWRSSARSTWSRFLSVFNLHTILTNLVQMGISSEFLRRRVLSAIAGLAQQEDLARTKLEGGAGSEPLQWECC